MILNEEAYVQEPESLLAIYSDNSTTFNAHSGMLKMDPYIATFYSKSEGKVVTT